jgi:hypothetical protein
MAGPPRRRRLRSLCEIGLVLQASIAGRWFFFYSCGGVFRWRRNAARELGEVSSCSAGPLPMIQGRFASSSADGKPSVYKTIHYIRGLYWSLPFLNGSSKNIRVLSRIPYYTKHSKYCGF